MTDACIYLLKAVLKRGLTDQQSGNQTTRCSGIDSIMDTKIWIKYYLFQSRIHYVTERWQPEEMPSVITYSSSHLFPEGGNQNMCNQLIYLWIIPCPYVTERWKSKDMSPVPLCCWKVAAGRCAIPVINYGTSPAFPWCHNQKIFHQW